MVNDTHSLKIAIRLLQDGNRVLRRLPAQKDAETQVQKLTREAATGLAARLAKYAHIISEHGWEGAIPQIAALAPSEEDEILNRDDAPMSVDACHVIGEFDGMDWAWVVKAMNEFLQADRPDYKSLLPQEALFFESSPNNRGYCND